MQAMLTGEVVLGGLAVPAGSTVHVERIYVDSDSAVVHHPTQGRYLLPLHYVYSVEAMAVVAWLQCGAPLPGPCYG